MAPLNDYLCRSCGFEFEAFSKYREDEPTQCEHCETPNIEKLPPRIGGYQGNLGPSSTRPKGAGSRIKGSK